MLTPEERKARKRERDKRYRETHKEQIKAIHKAWRDKNREYLNEKQREKYKENPQVFKKRNDKYRKSHLEQEKERRHRYKIENRQKCTDYQRNKRQTDPVYKFRSSFVHLIGLYRKKQNYTGNKGVWEIVGCDFETFLKYIQSQFTEGMTIENYGNTKEKWNIDHIEPIAKCKNDDDFERLNHYTNLRPLWVTENTRRAGKANGRLVYCVELDKVFESTRSASKELNLCQSCISRCCRGKQETHKGYHFEYVK
jgi:hypothetical protein